MSKIRSYKKILVFFINLVYKLIKFAITLIKNING